MNFPTPPRWAESVLNIVLAPQDRLTVSGDLLEEYRERIHPAKGQRAADVWYVRQVAGFVWRGYGWWAALLTGACVARAALDRFVPTTDYHVRSTASTLIGVGIFLSVGFVTAWRTVSFRPESDLGDAYAAGGIAGAITALIGGFATMVGLAILHWHDAAGFAAIDVIRLLAQGFFTPLFVLVVPGMPLAALGGLLGGTMRKLRHI